MLSTTGAQYSLYIIVSNVHWGNHIHLEIYTKTLTKGQFKYKCIIKILEHGYFHNQPHKIFHLCQWLYHLHNEDLLALYPLCQSIE